jgi:hypothetical protein
MAAARKVVELSITDEDLAQLQSIARSRTEPASRVERARILLRYREDPSCYSVGREVGSRTRRFSAACCVRPASA